VEVRRIFDAKGQAINRVGWRAQPFPMTDGRPRTGCGVTQARDKACLYEEVPLNRGLACDGEPGSDESNQRGEGGLLLEMSRPTAYVQVVYVCDI
jgi:hypothetical protein